MFCCEKSTWEQKIKHKIIKIKVITHQQNDRNVEKIELKKEGYRDAPMTPRDHFMKRKLGVKGPLDFTP